jgi:VWFA-related protein
MLDCDELQRQGMTALKAGDKTRAQALFAQLVKSDPNNERAWLCLAATVKNPDEQRYCLQRVLALNPGHTQAQRGLAALAEPQSVATPGTADPAGIATPTIDDETDNVPLEQVQATITALHHAQQEEQRLAAEKAAREAPAPGDVPLPEPHVPDAEHPARPFSLQSGDQVGAFTIMERAGASDVYELYVAHQGDPNWVFWLRRADKPMAKVSGVNQLSQFEHAGAHYQAMAMAGTTLEFAHTLAGVFSCPFIGRRWVDFARHVDYSHKQEISYQRSQKFTLRNLAVSGTGNIAPVSYSAADATTRIFYAPEQDVAGAGPPEISADIFALGSSFLYAVGEGRPQEIFGKTPPRIVGELAGYPKVIAVLRKATALDPAQRYADGEAFADALAEAFGDVIKGKEEAPEKKPRSVNLSLIVGLLVTVIVAIVAGGSAALFGVFGSDDELTMPSPMPASHVDISELPSGPLDVKNLSVSYEDDGRISFQITKGDQALPKDARVTYMLFLNGTHVEKLRKIDQQEDLVTLSFVAPQEIGMYRLRAEVSNGQDEEAIYYEPGRRADLEGAVAGAMQIDTKNYAEIITYFGLVDRHEKSVRLSGQAEVTVYQDGQRIENFSMIPVDPDQEPLTVALAINVSGSMYGEALVTARRAAADFVKQLSELDRVCLYIFATEVQQVTGCSSDHAAVIAAIEALETIDDTSLYDALARVSSDMLAIPGRRAVIVLSDGADTTSRNSFETALNMVHESNIPVYTIGLLSEKFDGGILQRLAAEADATYLEAPSAGEMRGLYDLIDQQLENQYRISFYSLYPGKRQGNIQITVEREEHRVDIERSFVVQ